MNDPTLLASREALAEQLWVWDAEHGAGLDAHWRPKPFANLAEWTRNGYLERADHLLASGVVQEPAEFVAGLVSALERTEANFINAVHGRPVRDMAETLAENRAAIAAVKDPQ